MPTNEFLNCLFILSINTEKDLRPTICSVQSFNKSSDNLSIIMTTIAMIYCISMDLKNLCVFKAKLLCGKLKAWLSSRG